MKDAVAVVGSGLIGRSWAVAFASSGWDVRLYDVDAGTIKATQAKLMSMTEQMAEFGLLAADSVATVLERIRPIPELAEALDGVRWVQENAPEQLETKKALWIELDGLAPSTAIMASSSSAIVPSEFSHGLKGCERCLIAHPLNPPHAIPAVELVPSPWTSEETLSVAEDVMRTIGMHPIRLSREIEGFVVNRLQGALLEEAFRLVESGVCTTEDVDIALRDGLALRWSFMGPFETIDLNAPGGVEDYVRRYEHIYESLFTTMNWRASWNGDVLARVVEERSLRLPRQSEFLEARQGWRDRRLLALLKHKKAAADEIGE